MVQIYIVKCTERTDKRSDTLSISIDFMRYILKVILNKCYHYLRRIDFKKAIRIGSTKQLKHSKIQEDENS